MLLDTSYLPGAIVEGTAAEWEPGAYRQAGALLAVLQVPGKMSVWAHQIGDADFTEHGRTMIERCPGCHGPGTAVHVQQAPSLFHAPDEPPGTSSSFHWLAVHWSPS
jgi:hypothetical protein